MNFCSSSAEGHKEVCNLASGVRLKSLSLPASLKETSLVQLDSMSLSQQMLVRCAAITGLTTELLFEILPCWNMKMMNRALATIVKSNVFYCFWNGKDLQLALKQNVSTFEVHYGSMAVRPSEGLAHCEEEELHEMEGELMECHILLFCRPVMQKTAYELWLKEEKKSPAFEMCPSMQPLPKQRLQSLSPLHSGRSTQHFGHRYS
ncbi:adenylate cyclase type 10-like [Nannospalax galili]|uniref:adenylate cyclase type 10-like n=1 Tax=Nannospalax galili TaxID=1026970 RepID=UPI00111C5D10|nr:adenylate cyclase type 10-like [Nannospalax galili]